MSVTGPVPAAVMGLMQLLPPPGTPWPEKRAWLQALRATIEVAYPDPREPTDEPTPVLE